MVQVFNKTRQVLTLNLNDGTSKHILAKSKEDLTSEQYKSEEVKNHIANGNLMVVRMS